MNRHSASVNGYAANKKKDDDLYNAYNHDRGDLESKFIWGMPDLLEDEKADPAFTRKFEPRKQALHRRSRLIRIVLFVISCVALAVYFFFPTSSTLSILSSGTTASPHYDDIETLRYYDLEDVQGTSVGWEREERVLLCTPLRDAAPHLPMFFAHLRNFTYPHHLIDLAFLVSDSKDDTKELLTKMLDAQQNDPDPLQPYGEISVIHKDFGQAVGQDVESRHGFAAQAGRRKLMARARNWLLSAALRPYHSWVYWRDADVETCPFTVIEDLMRHDKDIIVPSELPQGPSSCNTDLSKTSGVRFLTGSVVSSPTTSIPGKSPKQLLPLPTLWMKTLSLSKATPSMRPGDRILPTSVTPMATQMSRWNSMA
jgi:mannan polymerase II complex ANP1 subunit